MRYDLTVIGAGPGGYEAALEAARLGLRTAVVEKDAVGGTCLNRGCIPTKALMHAADLMQEMRGAARFGVCAGEPSIDMEAVQRQKNNTVDTLRRGILALFGAGKITLYTGAGKIAGPGRVEVQKEDGEQLALETERILIATGSVPSVPPIPGCGLPGVMTSDELLDYSGEPFPSLLIIGGGVIGVEFAGIYASFGTKVTVLEALPGLLANMDRELGQSIRMSLKKRGVDIHTGAKVEQLEQAEAGIRCIYTEKEEQKVCEAAAVLVATGRRPFAAGLFAEDCAPVMERGRIVTDEAFRTSMDGVYAIGDVSGRIQLAHAAAAQGKRAVRAIAEELRGASAAGHQESVCTLAGSAAGHQQSALASAGSAAGHHQQSALVSAGSAAGRERPLLIPSCVYTSPEIASVGMTLDEAKAAGIAAKSHKIVSQANGKSVLSLQERGFVKAVYEEEGHRILGAQLFCARATDMVSEFAVAIDRNMTMEEMAVIVRPHPSFSEMITDAVTL